MRGRVFNKLLDLPSRFYDRVNSSALVSRLTYYVEQIAEATTTVLTSTLKDTLTVIFYISFMFYLNWRLTTFAFVVMPFIAIIIAYVPRRLRRISVRTQYSVTTVPEAADEAVPGHRLVNISNRQDYALG